MKTLKEMTTVELLTSFNNGQGKTVDLPSFASVDNGTITYNGLTANVTQSWIEAFTLMQLHKELKDAPNERQAKLFQYYNDGKLSLNHTIGEAKKPLSGHYLTSEEYLNNVVRLSATFDNVNSILELVSNVLSDSKATKDDAIKALAAIRSVITPAEKLMTYTELQNKEQVFTAVKALLETIVESITATSDTSFKVSVKPVHLDTVVNIGATNGYTVEKADFDITTMSMVVEFKQA